MKHILFASYGNLIKTVGMLVPLVCFATIGLCDITVVERPNTTAGKSLYINNRPPLEPSPFIKLPIGSITPKGWLWHQLELEKKGLTGRLKEISPWLNFEKSAWGSKDGIGERGWEELPYWLKGYGDLGYVLNDDEIIGDARQWIDVMFASQRVDGWFGPRALLTSLDGKPDLWPHMVMLDVLQSYYEYSGDARVLALMTKYFHWQNQLPPSAFGEGYWPKIRAGDNIESIYWLYNRTGDAWLLELAKKIHDHMAAWHTDVVDWHNVNFAQGFRAGTVFSMQSQNAADRKSAERNYEKATSLYGQFPGGTIVADENARPGFTDPRGGFETCGIVEFMHSFEMLMKITGNPLWADRCEDIAFNSFPASQTPDLQALHYLTCANQIQNDRHNKSPAVQNVGTMFSYSPLAVYRCCQHNVSHGWPYYAEELWLATPDNGLCASLYAASEVTGKVGDGTQVKISETSDYPFSDTIEFRIFVPKAVDFAFYLRIPRWCDHASISINGKPVKVDAQPLRFVKIDRHWSDGDTVTLRMPMHVSVRRWEKNKNAASVDFGPLSFALRIDENWTQYGKNENWPEWEVFPKSAWNYGLVLDDDYEIVRKNGPLPDQPFKSDRAPIQLKFKARRIPQWQADVRNVVGPLQPSPVKSDEAVEKVTLIPMGAARLRISMFPVVGTGPDALEWPSPVFATVTASHCRAGDYVDAVNDNLLPTNSNDHRIPRFSWWDHKGGAEWIEYRFEKPKKLSRLAVYWFDDAGQGGCRVPRSWRALYKIGNNWHPVENKLEYGAKLNQFNDVTFTPVETTALRLEVQLQPEFSGGILEWKVTP